MHNFHQNTLLILLALSFSLTVGKANSETVKIYVDADMSHLKAAGESIVLGLNAALAQSENKLGGHDVEVVVLDHRRNSRRSTKNIQQAAADPQTLCIIGGVHSPCILANRELINQSKIPFLVPWAAAGPITRAPIEQENWIFRCSLDDSIAAGYLVEHAIKQRGGKRPFLLLEDTAWGHTNEAGLAVALEKHGRRPAGIALFPWSLTEAAANDYAQRVFNSGADSVILVANSPEGAQLCNALASSPKKLQITSHWGIIAGDFPTEVNHQNRSTLDIHFIHTRFSFLSYPNDARGLKALKFAKLETASQLPAPVGFIHAYDLGLLLTAAADQAQHIGDPQADRLALRKALENLSNPVEGLVKNYRTPFSSYSSTRPDAHEALNSDDFSMAYFREDGQVSVLDPKPTYERN